MAELILLAAKDADVVRSCERDAVARVKRGYAHAPSVDTRPIRRTCVAEDPFAFDVTREARVVGGDIHSRHHNIASLRSSDEDWM